MNISEIFSDGYEDMIGADSVSATFHAAIIELNFDRVIVFRLESSCGHVDDDDNYVPNTDWTLQNDWRFAEAIGSNADGIRAAVAACDEWFDTVRNHVQQIKQRTSHQ